MYESIESNNTPAPRHTNPGDFSEIKAVKRTPDAPPTPPRVQPPLSKTEKTVVRMLQQGMTEREVGTEMDRSHNTIHVHTRNIYRKLGVASRGMLFQLLASDPAIVGEEQQDEHRSVAA